MSALPELSPADLEQKAWSLYLQGTANHIDMGHSDRDVLMVAGRPVAWSAKAQVSA